jgi:hypothetical protein
MAGNGTEYCKICGVQTYRNRHGTLPCGHPTPLHSLPAPEKPKPWSCTQCDFRGFLDASSLHASRTGHLVKGRYAWTGST